MTAPAALAERALAVATAVAEAALGAPVRLRVEGSAEDWHRTLNRRIYEQAMSVWKPFAVVDVILNPEGRVIGYVDHEAYRRADDGTALDDDQLRALVLDEETLPPYARVVSRETYPGPEGGRLTAATVEGRDGGRRRLWLVEINAARRLVAAVRPLDFVPEA